ncbi:unnamed protein product [Closterium sp. NIES-53]
MRTPPLFSCVVVPSASSGSTKGGDPTAANTTTSCRSPRLETPPGFPPQTSSPPLHPVGADFGGLGVVGGGDAGGAGSGGAVSGGARSPLVGGGGGTGARGAGIGGARFGGALQSLPRQPIFLEQSSSSLPEPTPTCTTPPLLFPPLDSPLPARVRYVPLSVSLTGRREPVSCAASPAPSHVTREPVVLPLPPPSSLLVVPDPMSDLACAACPTIPCCLAALVTALASSPAAACALVAELAGFATTCRRAYLLVSFLPLRALRQSGVSLPLAVTSLRTGSASWSTCTTLSASGLATLRPGDTTLRIGGLLVGCCVAWSD